MYIYIYIYIHTYIHIYIYVCLYLYYIDIRASRRNPVGEWGGPMGCDLPPRAGAGGGRQARCNATEYYNII